MTWAAFLPSVPALLWQTALTTRGYTGHEQLDAVGLIHMNGRVYDPQLGRFLSADPFVQDASNLQALNPYSYVQNNPLSFMDPTGHFLSGLFKAIGHFFSSIFRAIEHAIKAVLSSSIFRAVLQIAACAFGTPVGCVAAAGGLTLAGGGTPLQAFEAMAFAGVSMAVWTNVGQMLRAEGLAGNVLAKGLVHGIVGGALSVARGGSFLNGFATNAVGAGVGLYSSQISGNNVAFDTAIVGAAGGLASQLTGGKFANGFVTAAFANLFNKYEKWVAWGVSIGTGITAAGSLVVDAATGGLNIAATPAELAAGGAIGGGFGYALGWVADHVQMSESSEDTAKQKPGDESPPKLPDFEHDDPTKAPTNPDGTKWVWRGPDAPGGDRGAWVNPDDF